LETIVLNGQDLSIEQVVTVANGPPQAPRVVLSEEARQRVGRAAEAVAQLLARGEVAYGITTGFGAFKERVIPLEQVTELQHNILFSHAVGVGDPFDLPTTRAIMLIRANTLARGNSGLRPGTLQLLLDMLNAGVHPVIPQKGSLGASGDLAPLAHMSLVLIGEGEAEHKGQRLPGNQALAQAGLAPVTLAAKEGLALTNGTAVMCAVGVLETYRARLLSRVADIAGCLSLEALHGTALAFDDRIQQLRPYPRQLNCAAYLRELLKNSDFTRHRDPVNVQIFIDDDSGEVTVLSGGNFHGEPLAIAMDYLSMAMTELGNIAERRIMRLTDEASNAHVLPAFLTRHGGLNSGFMITQYTAAALATENKVLAHPASVDTIPTSANVEDHVSMGCTAALQVRQIVSNVELILAIELMAAAQGIDFRKSDLGEQARLGRGTQPAYDLIRKHVPFLEKDAIMYPYVEAVRRLVATRKLVSAVNAQVQDVWDI
jgi:histidine ammonia-lyase